MNKPSHPPLIRAVGLFSLTAISINGMVGSGIFVLPAQVAAILGPAALSAYLLAGLAVGLIVLCFAEVAALFDRSGGPYLYARTSFGDFVGFEIGWMLLLARITSIGAISNAFSSYLGFFWPSLAEGAGRIIVISLSLGALGFINYRGVKHGARVNDGLTVAKLVPLAIFIATGLFALDPARAPALTLPDPIGLQKASLLLVFAFGGFEYAVLPGEETINPRRNLPIALLTAIAFVAVLYVLIQLVAQGTLPELATSKTPLASASQRFLGPAGGALLTVGAIISTLGTNSGNILTVPRVIYAMAEGGQLPAFFARVHPAFRTPHIAVVTLTLLGWACAVYSQFATLAALSAIARLVTYIATCLAVPALRRKMPHAERLFVLPGGPTIPILAVALSVWLIFGSSQQQILISGVALLVGAAVYRFRSRRSVATGSGN